MFKKVNGIDVPLTEAEINDFNEREAAHVVFLQEQKKTEYKKLRADAYPTLDEMLVALIEEKEGRPAMLDELMLRRLQVKNQYPKPTEI